MARIRTNLAWAFAWILHPLRRLGIPTAEVGFMLLLSLRFLLLVQEELQNLLRALATRPFQLRQLGLHGTMALLLGLGERLLANLLLRSEQGAQALMARGGQLLPPLTLRPSTPAAPVPNGCALVLLVLFVALRWQIGRL